MQSNYENLSAVELRELCLKGELDSATMSLEELEKLFGYESELDDPQAEILIFCSKGFDRFEKYREDIRKPSLKKIYREHYAVERKRTTKPAVRALQTAAAIVVILMLTAFTAQAVSLALGHNLFEYVRDWLFDRDTVGVLVNEPREDGSVDLPHTPPATDDNSTDSPPEDEFVFLDFEQLEDIDEVWLSRVSDRLVEGYEFTSADYLRYAGDEEFNFHFVDDNDNYVTLIIQNKPMFYIERENEGLVKEIIVNGIEFSIFRNMEDYHVIWEHEGYLYTFGAFLPLDEVMGIIEGWY